jgi:hypothetical protein
MTKFFFLWIALFIEISCSQNRSKSGEGYAKEELKNTLSNGNVILPDTLIRDKETAITISEAILFKVYDKANIIKQRPYEVNLIDGYWVLNGTLAEKMDGGTFLIILKASNAEVIKMTHGK